MAIHTTVETSMQGGIGKGIESTAMELILDNLQKYQYQFPVKSTVREIISNGLDSISERDVAKKILQGTHKVEDFFEEREGKIYQDSKFDPSYYDLKWLSSDTKVHMTYIEGNAIEKDKVEFRDNGVGLGDYRLLKYFQLGYSTKRLSKLPLGKFGIGGKAPLSTGVDFFTMESRYNGRKFKFNVYSHIIDSIIPRGEHYITFAEGTPDEYRIYYEPTEELNGVTISLQVKKNHKQQYIDAVKSQLLYFTNIDFNVLHDDGRLEPVDYQAEIIYEDDMILLSDNSWFSSPHLLLNKVNYGYISFEELELENKVGNIGIKIAPEDVDVNPSRESVIWSERTKSMVLARFESVVGIATELLQKELREGDYLKWLRTCYSISNRFFAGDSITSRLAKIVDLTQVAPAFLPNPNLRFKSASNLGGLYIRTVGLSTEIIASRQKTKVVRKEMKNIQTVIDRPIILMKKDERASNRKDKFLLSGQGAMLLHVNTGPSIFVTIYEPMTVEEMQEAGLDPDFIDAIKTSMNKRAGSKDPEMNNRYETWDALCKSADVIRYEDIVVPEDFKSTDDEIVEEEKKQTIEEKEVEVVARLSTKERRAQEGKLLIYTPRASGLYAVDGGGYKAYEWQKIEMPIKDMNDWDTEEIYYSDGMDELMHFVAMLSRDPDPRNGIGDPRRGTGFDKNGQYTLAAWQDKKWYRLNSDKMYNVQSWNAMTCQHFFDNKEIKLVKTSKANFKHLKDFRSIDRFFLTINNKTFITMSNLLIRWNTARIIKGRLERARFLTNFSQFNQRYHEQFMELQQYLNKNWRDVTSNLSGGNIFGLDKQTYDDMVKHLDKVQEFQEYVATQPTSDEVKHMAEYLFGNDQLKDGMAVDPEMIKKLRQVEEYTNGVGPLLNYIPILTNGGRVTEELEMEIKHYLDFKGMLNFKTEEDLAIEELQSMSPEMQEFIEGENKESEAIQDFQDGLTPHEEEMLAEEGIDGLLSNQF